MGLWNPEVKAFISSFFPWNLENGVDFATSDCVLQLHAVILPALVVQLSISPALLFQGCLFSGKRIVVCVLFCFLSPAMKVLFRETPADDSSGPVRINGTN